MYFSFYVICVSVFIIESNQINVCVNDIVNLIICNTSNFQKKSVTIWSLLTPELFCSFYFSVISLLLSLSNLMQIIEYCMVLA